MTSGLSGQQSLNFPKNVLHIGQKWFASLNEFKQNGRKHKPKIDKKTHENQEPHPISYSTLVTIKARHVRLNFYKKNIKLIEINE